MDYLYGEGAAASSCPNFALEPPAVWVRKPYSGRGSALALGVLGTVAKAPA
jgi:hypothetical protein